MGSPLGGAPGGLGGLGAAFVTVRAFTDQMVKDVKKGLEKLSKDSDKLTKESGEALGDGLAKNMEREIAKASFGRRIGSAFSRTFKRQKIKIDIDIDVDRNAIKRATSKVAGAIAQSFKGIFSAGGSVAQALNKGFGSVLGSIGSSIGNVGSKGPLGVGVAALLIFGIPALIAAVAALLNVFYPLINVLLLLPGALGILVGAIVPTIVAFSDLGDAVAAVQAAGKDPKRLAKVYEEFGKSQTKVAQEIARVIPWWKDLKRATQEAFFAPVARMNVIQRFLNSMGRTLFLGFEKVAASSAKFISNIILLVENPSVQRFFEGLFTSSAAFLDLIGPGFNRFLVGLAEVGATSLPYIEKLAQRISTALFDFGSWLGRLSQDTTFSGLMDRLSLAWADLKELADSGWSLIVAIVGSTDEQNGARSFLDKLNSTLDNLTTFFESEQGRVAMSGLIALAQIFLVALGSILGAWFGIGFAIRAVMEFFKALIGWIKSFWSWLGRVVDRVNGLLSKLGALGDIARALSPILNYPQAFGGIVPHATGGIVTSPTMALLGEGNGPEVVIPLNDRDRARQLAQASGLNSILGGTNSGTTIIFSPNSIQINGGSLSSGDAYQAGMAVGRGITDQLARRDTRLAIRTL